MIELAPADLRHLPFAWELYRAAMEPLGAAIGAWSEADERRIVERSFEEGEAQLIVAGSEPVGWLHVRITSRSMELWQLFVSPAHRRRGVGTAVLRRLQERATALGLPILLAVLRNNPAKRLYEREGFSQHAEGSHHLFLWWSPRLR